MLLDDIIVTGGNTKEHFERLEAVLARLEEKGLHANVRKCRFFEDKIEYCGHVIDRHGLHKMKEKTEAVVNAPAPTNVTELRSYLGLVNYYHRFLPDLATTLRPLNRLLEKECKWVWSKACEMAFRKSKELMTSDMVLTHYNPDLPLRVACDASPYGLGAVLSHDMPDGTERPIAFASRSLTKAEKNYSQINKEALGLVWSVKKFHQYVFGRKFTLVTDHQPLTSIFNPNKGIPAMTATRLQRYALFLGAHDYTIEYKNTKRHTNADGLSRLPLRVDLDEHPASDPVDLFHISQFETLPVTHDDVKRATRQDSLLSQVYELIMHGWPDRGNDLPRELHQFFSIRTELSVHQGCIMWGMRVVIPRKLQSAVLTELHSGHLGVVKMKTLSRSYVWWPGINHDIEHMAKGCDGCEQNQRMPERAPLHPWEWPSRPWQRVHIDYAGPFFGHMFLVVVDAHSKWPEVVMTKSTDSEKTIEILKCIFARNGLPELIVSDNGPQFVSAEFDSFLRQNGIRRKNSAPYHPATNGLAERFVQTLKQAMRAMKREKGALHVKLATFLLAYRNTPHCTTNETPAMLMMGRNLRTRLDLVKPSVRGTVEKNQASQSTYLGSLRQLQVGQTVAARQYNTKDEKWVRGVITAQDGPLSYQVKIRPDTTVKRHIDQIMDSLPVSESALTLQPEGILPTVGSTLTSSAPPHRSATTLEPVTLPTEATSLATVNDKLHAKQGAVLDTLPLRRSQRAHRAPDRLDL